MKFRRLEAVRGFSSAYVAVGHWVLAGDALPGWHWAFRFGQEAVIVFFVLSGFVIGWTTKDTSRRPWVGAYFKKRIIRIYSVVLLMIPALWMIDRLENSPSSLPSRREIFGNLLMLQDFEAAKPAVFCPPWFGDTPLWSLHYEWWFYVLFPVVCLLPRPEFYRHVVGIVGVASSIVYSVIPNIPCRLAMYFTVWWIGVEAAMALRQHGRVTLRMLAAPLAYAFACGIPMVALVMSVRRHSGPLSVGVHPVLELRHLWGAVVLILLAFAWRRVQWVGFAQTVALFGIFAPISYSLYVIHYRSIAYAKYLSGVVSPALELPVYMALTLAFCIFAECVFFPSLRKQFDTRRKRSAR